MGILGEGSHGNQVSESIYFSAVFIEDGSVPFNHLNNCIASYVDSLKKTKTKNKDSYPTNTVSLIFVENWGNLFVKIFFKLQIYCHW